MSVWRLAGTAVVIGAVLTGCSSMRSPFERRSDLVAEPNPCAPQRFEVYFTDGEARLTEAARHAIGLTATQLQGCDIRRVQVVGLADASGGDAANLSLSERRAMGVRDALMAAGWPAPVFDIAAAGETGAVTTDGTREPMRRRTEVLVEAAPRR